MLPSRVLSSLAFASFVFAACGGKTLDDAGAGTPATEAGPETSPPTEIDAGGRTCPSECLIGHQCCIGGCGGIPAAMPNSCCSCLQGETDSQLCTNSKCGN